MYRDDNRLFYLCAIPNLVDFSEPDAPVPVSSASDNPCEQAAQREIAELIRNKVLRPLSEAYLLSQHKYRVMAPYIFIYFSMDERAKLEEITARLQNAQPEAGWDRYRVAYWRNKFGDDVQKGVARISDGNL